jgi:hypothetical protein
MSGEHFDDPNREAVGLEPAWAEGSGGAGTSGGSGPTREQDADQPAQQPAARPAGGGQYGERPDDAEPGERVGGFATPQPAKPLDDMTKAELIEYAEQTGAEVDESMTKAQIREAIGS